MNQLQIFYNNENEREAVRAFMFICLRELAADYALEGKETNGFKETKEVIEKLFDTLEEKYGIIKKPINQSPR